MPTKVISSLQLKYNVHEQYDDYNDRPTDHVISLEYLIYILFYSCTLCASCTSVSFY